MTEKKPKGNINGDKQVIKGADKRLNALNSQFELHRQKVSSETSE